jgi:hypothetical protein
MSFGINAGRAPRSPTVVKSRGKDAHIDAPVAEAR